MLEFQINGYGGTPNPPLPPQNPDVYAQQYANENGISLDEAKAQLKAKYGEPQKPNSTFANDTTNVSMAQLQQNAIFNFMPPRLQQNGTNSVPFMNFATQSPNDNKKLEQLRELGIPSNIIAQGDDAIRKYAQDHNIDLPAKERS